MVWIEVWKDGKLLRTSLEQQQLDDLSFDFDDAAAQFRESRD